MIFLSLLLFSGKKVRKGYANCDELRKALVLWALDLVLWRGVRRNCKKLRQIILPVPAPLWQARVRDLPTYPSAPR